MQDQRDLCCQHDRRRVALSAPDEECLDRIMTKYRRYLLKRRITPTLWKGNTDDDDACGAVVAATSNTTLYEPSKAFRPVLSRKQHDLLLSHLELLEKSKKTTSSSISTAQSGNTGMDDERDVQVQHDGNDDRAGDNHRLDADRNSCSIIDLKLFLELKDIEHRIVEYEKLLLRVHVREMVKQARIPSEFIVLDDAEEEEEKHDE